MNAFSFIFEESVLPVRTQNAEKNFVLVELKQWESAEATEIPELVHTFVGGRFRDVVQRHRLAKLRRCGVLLQGC